MISKKLSSFAPVFKSCLPLGKNSIKHSLGSAKFTNQISPINKFPSEEKPLINSKIAFNFNTQKINQSMIQSLQQYQNGCSMLQKGQYPIAIRQFQMALKFLPKNIQDDINYQHQYQGLLKKLLQAHVFMNKPIQKYRQLYNQHIDQDSKFNKFLSVVQDIEKGDFKKLQAMQTEEKLWKELVRVFSFKHQKQCFGKHLNIEKVAQSKDLALKYIGLYLFQKIKNRTRKDRQTIYLDACRQLLKQTQQLQPNNIVKPLSLMASNLLAGDQYLQTQGLLSHCLTNLQQFHAQNSSYLKTDQQYIMCKLLMARVFQGVNRKVESERIREQYGNLFDQKKFILQQLLQISYREL